MSLTDTQTAPAHPPARGIAIPVIFTATIFLSAALLFFVQPLFAKLILPRIGGAPAVWTTAMLFFQTVLIAGYVYAHLLIRYVPTRMQLGLHLAFWAAALFYLPLAVSEGWSYDPARSTATQTLILLATGVGVPFAMLSANAPLLQAWYARSGGPQASDPYFLYGASNVGSLLALMAFPLLAEPFFGARIIGLAWAAGFLVLGAGLLISGLVVRGGAAMQASQAPRSAPLAPRHVMTWLFLAFVPSSLMLSITTEISTDLGAFPLIWVVPLGLYILSFVVTFARRRPPAALIRATALLGVLMIGVLVSGQANAVPSWIKALLFAPALFAVATALHGMLYDRRPDAGNLTVFYITMSVGGALGGLANSILAPVVFSGVAEGTASVLLAAAALLIGARMGRMHVRLAITAGFATLALLLVWAGALPFAVPDAAILMACAALAIAAAVFWQSPLAVATSLALLIGIDGFAAQKPHLFKDRSFFGAHAVRDEGDLRIYTNGTTIHGQMFVGETGRPTPLSYYHPQAPMARVLTSDFGTRATEIGIVGLGVGSLACYARPHQNWTYFEIDAMVDRVARDTSLFRFLSECTPDAPTLLGDARIVLRDREAAPYDILVLDAYSSDAIPMHLVTAEAMALYLGRLRPDGMLVFHISNRYYDLRQPLARIGAAAGLSMAIDSFRPDPDDPALRGAKPSVVVALSPDPARIAELQTDPRWQPLLADDGPVWTDDFANLLSALK